MFVAHLDQIGMEPTLYPVTEGMTVRDFVETYHDGEFQKPTVCVRNDKPLLRRDWDTRIESTDTVVFVALPAGGGGGGSNPMKAVMMIAVMVAAAYLGPQIAMTIPGMTTTAAGVTTLTTMGQIVAGAIGGIVTMAGSMLVNAIMPSPTPSLGNMSAGFGSTAAASPTYTLEPQQNQARLMSPIPVAYGYNRMWPDLASQPYAEYESNDQYVYQLFCLGQGRISVP